MPPEPRAEFVDANSNNIVIDATVVNRPFAQSPLFNNAQYATGFTQFENSVMRAEFFPLFNKNGNNSEGSNNYHVLLGNPQTNNITPSHQLPGFPLALARMFSR